MPRWDYRCEECQQERESSKRDEWCWHHGSIGWGGHCPSKMIRLPAAPNFVIKGGTPKGNK